MIELGNKMVLFNSHEMGKTLVGTPDLPRREKRNLRPANLEELQSCLRSGCLAECLDKWVENHVIALDSFYPMKDDAIDDEARALFRGYKGSVRRVKGISFIPGEEPSIGGYDFDGYNIGETWYQPKWDDSRFWFLYICELIDLI